MNDKVVKIAAVGFIGLVVTPVILDAGLKLICLTVGGIDTLVNKVKFKKEIKKGLKDGSIVEIDGQYYRAEVIDAKIEEV